jgi:hypothetical protein
MGEGGKEQGKKVPCSIDTSLTGLFLRQMPCLIANDAYKTEGHPRKYSI